MSRLPVLKFGCGTFSQIRESISSLIEPCGRKRELPYNFSFDDRLKRSQVNDSYYIRLGVVSSNGREGNCLRVSTDVELCLYHMAGKLEVDTQERALIEGEGILTVLLDESLRPECFTNIRFDRMFLESIPGNDYIVKICIGMTISQAILLNAGT